MPYRVKQDGATVARNVSVRRNILTGQEYPTYKSDVYLEGDVLDDSEVSDYLKEQLEAGDEHVEALLEYTDDEPNLARRTVTLDELHRAEGAPELDEPGQTQESYTGNDLESQPEKAEVQKRGVAKAKKSKSK